MYLCNMLMVLDSKISYGQDVIIPLILYPVLLGDCSSHKQVLICSIKCSILIILIILDCIDYYLFTILDCMVCNCEFRRIFFNATLLQTLSRARMRANELPSNLSFLHV